MEKQNVKREERLGVKLLLQYPDLHANKGYIDPKRNHLVLVDGVEVKPIKGISEEYKLRSLITVKKRYGEGSRVDSTFTYRVGENFAELEITNKKLVRVAVDFSKGNILKVLDNTSSGYSRNIIKS